MDYRKALILILILFFPALVLAADIFSDGFESGNFSNWTLVGQNWNIVNSNAPYAHSGSQRAEVKGNVSDSILLKQISTANYQNITLSYWYKIGESLEDADHVYVEWFDGASWSQLEDFTSIAKGDWLQKSYLLPNLAVNNPNFAFRFRATLGAATSDIFRLDDVYLNGESIAVATAPLSPLPPAPESTPTPELTLPPTQPTQEPTPAPNITPTPTSLPVQELSPLLTQVPAKIISPQVKKVTKPKKESATPQKIEAPLQASVQEPISQPKNPSLDYLIYGLTIGVASVILILKLKKFWV